jgi:hypothetical protein
MRAHQLGKPEPCLEFQHPSVWLDAREPFHNAAGAYLMCHEVLQVKSETYGLTPTAAKTEIYDSPRYDSKPTEMIGAAKSL